MITFWISVILITLFFVLATFIFGANVPESQSIEKKQKILDSCRYWDCWTGSRYVRTENPLWNTKNSSVKDAVARSNPVTGDWEVYSRI